MTQVMPAAAGWPAPWRTAAFAALPLVLAGMVPLPALLGLAAAFALTAREDLRLYRPQFSLLVLAVNLLVTLWLAVQAGDQRYTVAAFFVVLAQMGVAYLTVYAAEQAEEQRGRGWLWLLPAFVLAPHPLGLVSLGAAALLRHGADDRALADRWQGTPAHLGSGPLDSGLPDSELPDPGLPDSRPDSGGMERARSVWPWLAGALALALAAALLLPRVSLWDQAVAYMGVTEQVTVTDNSPQPSAPAPGDSAQPGRVAPPTFTPGTPAASANQDLSRAATGYLDLMTVAVLLATLLYALTSLRRQLRLPGTPPGWPQVWPLLALVALPLSLLAVILAAQFQALDITVVEGEHAPVPPSPPAGPLEAAVQQVVGLLAETPLGNLDLYNMLFLLLGTLFLFALLAWVWHLLTARARPTYAWEETREAASAARAAAPAHAPLHRVRLAYAQVEAHLAAAGVHRRAAETPAEYLRRAAAEWPEVAAPLEALGAAYAPVRYGGGVSEGGANLAEQNAEMITAFIRQEPG